MIKLDETRIIFESREEWRAWLEANHLREKEIRVVYFKKHTGKDSVSYDEAVEEALCFGWIDSKVNRVDDEMYMQIFTPRKPKSLWSELNTKRVEKLIKLGKMKPAGMKLINLAKKSGTWQNAYSSSKKEEMPDDFKTALSKNKKAMLNFTNFAEGYQNRYIAWIQMAKRPGTREKRIREVVKFAWENRKPGF